VDMPGAVFLVVLLATGDPEYRLAAGRESGRWRPMSGDLNAKETWKYIALTARLARWETSPG